VTLEKAKVDKEYTRKEQTKEKALSTKNTNFFSSQSSGEGGGCNYCPYLSTNYLLCLLPSVKMTLNFT